jgi:hypothetical protein
MKDLVIGRINDRALVTSAAEAAAFPYDAVDMMIAQNVLAGINTDLGLSKVIPGVSDVQIRNRLLDPVRCAWLSQQLSAAISQRLGLVLSAVYGRALQTGDPRAAELLLKRYGDMAPVKTEQVHHIVDYSKLPKDILEKMISEKMRNLGVHQKETINVTDDEEAEIVK